MKPQRYIMRPPEEFLMTRLRLVLFLSLLPAALQPLAAQQRGKLRFEITVPRAVRSEPLTGRVFVMISRKNEPEPRLQIGRTGVPFFGRDIEKLAAGAVAVV